MTLLVTGGAGFIGSNFVRQWLDRSDEHVVNLDKLAYAGNLASLDALQGDVRHCFVQGDLLDRALLDAILAEHRPRAVLHFAAESHVDRSISGPEAFVQSNIVGTFHLLQACLAYWSALPAREKSQFRFLHVSTDEVYGTLMPDDPPFLESSRYAPNSPYSASKAASDHLVRAWHETYGLPVLITNCSNNYGPFQFPEKLIPRMITSALAGAVLPVYGDGLNVRDWLHVHDHCTALRRVLAAGIPGETYNIGGSHECTNIEIVRSICALLDELRPRADGMPYQSLIRLVADRPGHDRRYAIDSGKIRRELGWQAGKTFITGLRQTVQWYLENPAWLAAIEAGDSAARSHAPDFQETMK